ncbi:mitochondrial distribution and morphology protein 10 [Mrakia frigida]|uniref:Mdm10p n=1 Tax=Mrakia frigida TaxID=29902 RepID=UPI003FCBFD4D
MLPFQTLVLRRYFEATGWEEDALYSALTASSSRILDFSVPTSLHLAFSKTPTPGFHNSFETTVLREMNGSLGYFASSRDLDIGSSEKSAFRDVVDGFRVHDMPRTPEPGEDEIWQGGERVDTKDFLMYGRCHLPSRRVDGLFLRRHSPTLQSILAFVHSPSNNNNQALSSSPHFKGNALLSLQHSVGRYSTETSFSFSDGLLGVRGLYNFAPSSSTSSSALASGLGLGAAEEMLGAGSRKAGRVDEEESLLPGVRGRLSMGGEIYLSGKEKSAGMSIAARFCTLPDQIPPPFPSSSSSSSSLLSPSALSTPSAIQSQTPMTFTLVVNPLMGHTSAAYSSQIGKDVAVSSRFDLNFYSYQSEWTIGGEWWLRKAAVSPGEGKGGLGEKERELGVLKMRTSTAGDVSLLYTTRVSKMLISAGVVSDLGSRLSPVKALGVEIQYFR